MLVHPDRCPLPSAEDAFAAASQAMEILKEQAEALLRGPPPAPPAPGGVGGPMGSPGDEGGCAAEAERGAVVRFVDVEELLQQVGGWGPAPGPARENTGVQAGARHSCPAASRWSLACRRASAAGSILWIARDSRRALYDFPRPLTPPQVVWNQNRLAVPAVLVPPAELRRRGLLHPAYQQQFAEGSSLAAEPLVFLPVASIPTLKKRRRLLAAPPALRAAAAGGAAAAAAAAGPAAVRSGAQQGAQDPEEVQQHAGPLEEQPHPTSTPLKLEQPDSPPASPPATQPDGAAGSDPPDRGPATGCGPAGVHPDDVEAGVDDEHPGRAQPQHCQPEEGPGGGGDLVEGLLLVSARAALWGRFPLNGTYFQAGRGRERRWEVKAAPALSSA